MNTYRQISTVTATICCVIAGLTGFMLGHHGPRAVVPSHAPEQHIASIPAGKVVHNSRPAISGGLPPPTIRESEVVLTEEQKSLALEAGLMQRHIDDTTAKESWEYLPLFEDLGLSREQGAELIERLKRLHADSARVNHSVIKLNEARNEYDSMIKSILAPESYEKYRAFESGRKARTELAEMETYLGKRNQTLTPSARDTILAALEKHPAITTESWHGPYDPVPRPLIGEEVIPHMQQFIATVTSIWPGLSDELSRTLSFEEIISVHAYYTNRLSFFERVLDSARNPPDPEKELQEHLERVRKIRETASRNRR